MAEKKDEPTKTDGKNAGDPDPAATGRPKAAADQAKSDQPNRPVAQTSTAADEKKTELDRKGEDRQPPSADVKLEDLNPQAVMDPPDGKTLTDEQMEALASPGLHRAERAWHRHYLNTKQMLNCKIDGKTVKAGEMLGRVQTLLRTGEIRRAAESPG